MLLLQILPFFLEIPFAVLAGLLVGYAIGYMRSKNASDNMSEPALGNISIVEVSLSERELEELVKEIESWEMKRYERFLSNFMLQREIDVIRTLASVFASNKGTPYGSILDMNKGWLNRHQIHIRSKVSRKLIYSPHGVLERLVTLKLVIKKQTASWGREKHRYRINTVIDTVQIYVKCVIDYISQIDSSI